MKRGTCDDSSIWGPVVLVTPATETTWQVVFEAWPEVPSGTAWPAFESYFCRVGLGYDDDGRGYHGGVNVMPAPDSPYIWALTDPNATQVLELNGTIN